VDFSSLKHLRNTLTPAAPWAQKRLILLLELYDVFSLCATKRAMESVDSMALWQMSTVHSHTLITNLAAALPIALDRCNVL
jgi:hypothetical protein